MPAGILPPDVLPAGVLLPVVRLLPRPAPDRHLDLARLGFELYFHFVCTEHISDRSTVADEALALPQVLEVTELMTGQQNLHIKAVGATDEDITSLARHLDELDLEIDDENPIRAEHTSPADPAGLSELLEADAE